MRAALNTLLVLETVADAQPAGVSAVARATGLPKSSAQRCLSTLHDAGWLMAAPDDRTRWVLTGKALTIGLHASADLGLREAALATMRELHEKTAETIHLSSCGGAFAKADSGESPHKTDTLVITERIDSTQPVRTWIRLGTQVPLHASCSGRAVLATLPDNEVDRLVAGPLERYTEQSLTDREELAADLRTVRATGYATVDGGWRPGVGAVAAALLDAHGRPVGAIAISMPIQRYDAGRARELGPLVVRAAHDINGVLAGVRPS